MAYKKISFWVMVAALMAISLIVVKCVSYEINAENNVNKCEKVKNGMSFIQVIEIMGKPDNIKTYNAKINYKDLEVTKYYYDAPSWSSVGVNIFFGAKTKKVIRTECKD